MDFNPFQRDLLSLFYKGTLFYDLFSLLCQGTVAGLIVLFFSEYFQKRRRKRLLKLFCDTLLIELENHLVCWERVINKEPIVDKDFFVLKSNSVFDKNLEIFHEMNLDHARIILYYFNSAYSIFERLDVRRFHDIELECMYLTAQQVQCCLIIYCARDDNDRASALSKLPYLEQRIFDLKIQQNQRSNPI